MSKKIGFSTIQPIGDKKTSTVSTSTSKNKAATTRVSTASKKITKILDSDARAYYKNRQEESIKKFKEMFPNGAVIAQGDFLSIK